MTQHRPVPGPQSGRLRLAPVVAAAVAVVLVLGAVGGYFVAGAAVAAGDRLVADQALERARQDNNQVSGSLAKLPDVGMTARNIADVAQAKSNIDGYVTKLKQSRALLNADVPKLLGASDKLRKESGNPLVARQRASLDQERGRLDLVITAFSAAEQYLRMAEEQLTLDSAVVDAAGVFDAMTVYVERQDFAGALAQYPEMERRLQQTVALSKTPNTPPQLQTQLNGLVTTTADFKKLLEALPAMDFATIDALQPKVDQDVSALDKYDQQAVNDFYDQLFKPYHDRYVTSLKQAGFQVTLT
jgi:hypothetical protein